MSSRHHNTIKNDVAIKLEGVSKCYQIYEQPHHRLLQGVFRGRRQYFKEFWALKDISFEVKKGETVGIIGRNGSGKSTLLQIICGTLTPTSGTVEAHGRVAALLELGSGFNPEFTGRENIYMNAAVLGLSKEETDERFDDIAAFADIGEFINQSVKTYSSGMYLRLAFAVQAMIDPNILVVDEALSVGDEKFQRKCFARLQDLKDNGTSILFVSHSGNQISELCDKVVFLERGLKLMYSHPSKAIRAYQKFIYAYPKEADRLLQNYLSSEQVNNSSESHMPVTTGALSCDSIAEFDPTLVAETTMKYPVQGAEINSFLIFDVAGNSVNILQPGCSYRFIIVGRFLVDVQKVYFAIHIRSISGTVITGQRYPIEGKFIEQVPSPRRFRITFEFKMVLIPGLYFVGGGVWSYSEPTCLHRILDAIVFRVISSPRLQSFGFIDASSKEPLVEIF